MKTKQTGHRILAVLAILAVFLYLPTPSPAQAAEAPSQEQLKEILERFEESVERTRKEFKIPGMAVAVIQSDELAYVEGFGVREINGAETVNPETIFQIGSTSKAFTAALVASVVDEGVLGWKDPVRSHLPDFAMADSWVTDNFQVRDLMAQHSGMKPYAGDVLVLLGYGREEIKKKKQRPDDLYPPVDFSLYEGSYVSPLFGEAEVT